MDSRLRLGGNERRALALRLEARRAEIERATLTRVEAVGDPARVVGPEYAEGLRAAVSAAVDFGLGAVASGEGATPEIPAALLVQARLAARHEVELGVVLRRYAAGYTLLGQCLAEEAEREGVARYGLAHLLEVQATLFDRLVVAVTDEYGRECGRPASVERRRAALVKGLLDGDFVDRSLFAYDFEACHVAVVARGPGACEAVDALAGALGCRRLVVPQEDETVWGWLGRSDRPPPLDGLDPRAIGELGVCLAVGEPGLRLAGWRRSHQQASAAFVVAARDPGAFVRYGDVALVASVLQDDLLSSSLTELYLDPLHEGHADGEALIETLSAYFDADRNGASAAAALGVSRQAVQHRLRVVEERIGRPLVACAVALETALDIDRLNRTSTTLAHVKR